MKNFKIEEPDNKKRLDKFLTEQLSDFSRSQIQKMIKNGQITVNDKTATPHHFLKIGDNVILSAVKHLDSSTKFTPTKSVGTQNDKKTLTAPEIIHEDDNILVINKPAGILTHARAEAGDSEPTLVDWLVKKYPKIKQVGDRPDSRPGIVHRLDKEASGAMVVAKTQQAFEALKKQFHNRQVIKEYIALSYGQIKADYANIEFPVGRSREGGRMAARAKDAEGKPSVTTVEVVNRFPNCTLIKAFPKTGRTHQIRVHLFALGNPLVGDPLYKSKKFKTIPTGRLMLHSRKLILKNLAGEEKTFTAQTPREFEKYLP